MIGIYKITNTINGKVYIGQSQNIEGRWAKHKRSMKDGKQILYRAMRKYGIENFNFEVIEECYIEELNNKEIYYIKKYNSFVGSKNSKGYNMTLGGEGLKGYTTSEETKAKLRLLKIGKKLSKEHRKKMSESGRGRVFTEEHKRKISETQKIKKTKKVICNNCIFNSLRECATSFNIPYNTMCSWISGRVRMREDFVNMNLHYATDEEIEKFKQMEQVS